VISTCPSGIRLDASAALAPVIHDVTVMVSGCGRTSHKMSELESLQHAWHDLKDKWTLWQVFVVPLF
jgi:hypothetical protein